MRRQEWLGCGMLGRYLGAFSAALCLGGEGECGCCWGEDVARDGNGVQGESRVYVPPACGYRIRPVLMKPLNMLRARRRVREADEMESGRSND